MFNDVHFYLDFDWEHYIINQESYWEKMNKLIGLAYQHRTRVYYSKEQLTSFAAQCQDLDDNFNKSVGNKLSVLLENAHAVNNNTDFFFSVQANGSASFITFQNLPILKIISSSEKITVITQGSHTGVKYILKVRSNDEFERVMINFTNDPKLLIEWLNEVGPKRVFNLSPKHGESGVGEWQGESKLMCDKKQAQTLLNGAIADFGKKKRFFNYDEHHNLYIEFFYEGDNPQTQWHGFHLEEHNWNRVPISIRTYFGR